MSIQVSLLVIDQMCLGHVYIVIEPVGSARLTFDDDPRTPIQQSVGEEFRQHDGVVTILLYYRRRASPKHRYNITEVDYGGGGPHTAKRSRDQLLCLEVPPCPRI